MIQENSNLSVLAMQRQLEIKSYKTAWLMSHKIHKALADQEQTYKLRGIIEMHHMSIGTKKKAKKNDCSEGESRIVVSVENRVFNRGFCHMDHIPALTGKHILSIAEKRVAKDSCLCIRTGREEAYRALKTDSFCHEELDHRFKDSRDWRTMSDLCCIIAGPPGKGWEGHKPQWLDELFGRLKAMNISNIKNGLLTHEQVELDNPELARRVFDSFHLVEQKLVWVYRIIKEFKKYVRQSHRGVSAKHLQRYLSAFCYRFNAILESQPFGRVLQACAATSTIIYAELVA